jgi:bifunctional DNase/RNase
VEPTDPSTSLTELNVVGVRVELPSQQPIVLLKEVDGDRYLPIWIGAWRRRRSPSRSRASSPPVPMTHDLMRDLLEAFTRPLLTVTITELREGVFYAELGFDGGVTVSARPSDAIALAIRTGAVIRGEEAVLVEAGIAIPDEQEDEVEKFREFLDTITPEDFEQES